MSLSLAAMIAATLQAAQPTEPLQPYCPLYMVLFDDGSAEVTPQARAIIDNWIGWVRHFEAPYNRYTIQAHADSRGPAAGNLELSWRRGRAIARYLARRSFDPARIRIHAMGESEPLMISSNPSVPDHAQNRRANLVFETTRSNIMRYGGGAQC